MKLSYPLAFLAIIGMAVALPADNAAPSSSAAEISSNIKDEKAEVHLDNAGADAKEGTEKLVDAAGEGVEAVKNEAGSVKDDVKAKLGKATEKTKEFADKTVADAQQAASEVQEKVKSARETIEKYAADFATGVKKNWNGTATWQNSELKKALPKAIVGTTIALVGTAGIAYGGHQLAEHHRATRERSRIGKLPQPVLRK